MTTFSVVLPVLRALPLQEGGVSLRQVIASIPTEPAAIFVYLLVAGVLAAIAWAHRPGRDGEEGPGSRPG